MDKQVNDYFGFSCIKSMHILGIILTAEAAVVSVFLYLFKIFLLRLQCI